MPENFFRIVVSFFPLLCRDPNLIFVEMPALQPPEIKIDNSELKRYEAELQQCYEIPLPDDDNDFEFGNTPSAAARTDTNAFGFGKSVGQASSVASKLPSFNTFSPTTPVTFSFGSAQHKASILLQDLPNTVTATTSSHLAPLLVASHRGTGTKDKKIIAARNKAYYSHNHSRTRKTASPTLTSCPLGFISHSAPPRLSDKALTYVFKGPKNEPDGGTCWLDAVVTLLLTLTPLKDWIFDSHEICDSFDYKMSLLFEFSSLCTSWLYVSHYGTSLT